MNAFSADKIVLTCITPGDALEGVLLIERGNTSVIRVEFLKDDNSEDGSGNVGSEEFAITTSLKNVLKGDSDTLIGVASNSDSFGGGRSNAVLMRVLTGQKGAYLAKDGMVFNLDCHK